MQSTLIKEIFAKFISDFDHFLGSWEEGFRNDFIVNLFTRKYKEYEQFVNAGHELESIILITGGSAHCLSKEDYMFMKDANKYICFLFSMVLVGYCIMLPFTYYYYIND